LRFRVWGSGFGVQGLGFRVRGSGFGVWGLGFGVWNRAGVDHERVESGALPGREVPLPALALWAAQLRRPEYLPTREFIDDETSMTTY